MGYDIELYTIDKKNDYIGKKGYVLKEILENKDSMMRGQNVDEWVYDACSEWIYALCNSLPNVVDFRSRYVLPTVLKHFKTEEPHLTVTLNVRESKSLAKSLEKMLKKPVNSKGELIGGELEKLVKKMIRSLKSGKRHLLYVG